MVKSYVKYEQSHSFGVVCTGSSNLVWAPQEDASTSKTGSGIAYVSANEEVLSWDVRKGQLLSRWKDVLCNAAVTAVAKSVADESIFAVGHADGSIRIWDSRINSCLITFNGHKSAVTVLEFDRTGARLASGSKDTDVILWDLLGEVGLFKLRGHKDQVTALQFLYPQASDDEEELPQTSEGNVLLSTSKDALIKVWELSSQHCIETHVAQTNGECWAMSISPDGTGCITAGNDGEMKVWSIDSQVLLTSLSDRGLGEGDRVLQEMGILYRQGKDRTTGIHFHHKADYIAIHGSEKAIEIWRIRGEEEIKKSLARKRKRRREKAAQKGEEFDEAMDEDGGKTDIKEAFVPYTIVRTGGKIRSVAWAKTRSSKSLQLIATATNNLIEAYTMTAKERVKKKSKYEDEVEYNRTSSVELPGHRADVRAVALSSDDKMLATASNGSLKIWNVQTRACIRTLECGYALCVSFVPGDKIIVVGTKSGDLELFDIASSTLLEKVQAHEGSVWTLAVHPDGRSVVTGSADNSAKFWAFEIFQEEIPGTKRTTPRLRLKPTRIIKLNDDVLKLCFSPDARLLALSTLDNTVKVFFTDSLKVFLNLYGHKLPVLDIAISSDSKLITTCSADKNIRIWGLDFGDCHKALFAHQDSIMAVRFIPHPIEKTDAHLFFSASKDRTIKAWDGDKFEQIQKLDAHHGEIWALAVSRTGDFVVTASHDKSIRIWSQTDEPLFLEEEREKDLEELHEAALQATLNDEDDPEARDQVASASKPTIQTLTAGERIVEALELGVADLVIVQRYEAQKKDNPIANIAPPQRDPLFMALGGISAERHVLNTMARIPAPSLQDALLVLPFSMLPALFTFLAIFVRKQWNMPLTCRVLFFMLKTHQRPIVSSGELRLMLEALREALRGSLEGLKDVLGFNLAALSFVGGKVRDNENVRLKDVLEDNGDKKARKRAFVEVA